MLWSTLKTLTRGRGTFRWRAGRLYVESMCGVVEIGVGCLISCRIGVVERGYKTGLCAVDLLAATSHIAVLI